MKNISLLCLLLMGVFTFSCKKTDADATDEVKKAKLQGNIQKGPFINGTTVFINELDKQLIQTGKTYTTNIQDNSGYFELKNTVFVSPYVQLSTDGFYFNEVRNVNSTSRVILNAISDLTNKSTINANVITHLEKGRVEFLVNQGKSFNEAKAQAQKELLAIFEIVKTDIKDSEDLDISKNTEDNAILLAVSCILQGYRTEADLSALLGAIITDIKTDGVLNDAKIGSALINSAKLLDKSAIRTNIEKHYQSLGTNAIIPPFEKYIDNFISKTKFIFTETFSYPATSLAGFINILNTDNKIFSTDQTYVMYANIPQGRSLKVKISAPGGGLFDWEFPSFQENTGWTYTDFNEIDNSRFFTSNRSGLVEFKILFSKTIKVEIFEDNASTPTKIITLTPTQYSAVNFPVDGQFGKNILALPNGNIQIKLDTYSYALEFSNDKEHTFEIKVFFTPSQYSIDKTKNQNWAIEENTSFIKLSTKGKGTKADIPITLKSSGKVACEAYLDGKYIPMATIVY